MASNHAGDELIEDAVKLAWTDVKPDETYKKTLLKRLLSNCPAKTENNSETGLESVKEVNPDKKRDH